MIADFARQLIIRPDVHSVAIRDETGRWNVDPEYPDGIYLFVECADETHDRWTLDIWVVDDPKRKPALLDVERLGPRIDPITQAAILAIKRSTGGRRRDGTRLPSIAIYQAVLDDGVRTTEEFARRSG